MNGKSALWKAIAAMATVLCGTACFILSCLSGAWMMSQKDND